jgi:formate hydrogenlyase subunit 3/multisubunit Na+/H+ antiporter MnhD subunit
MLSGAQFAGCACLNPTTRLDGKLNMDALIVLIPILPFIAAVVVGVGAAFGVINGEQSENTTSTIAIWAISMSCLLALVLLGQDFLHQSKGYYTAGIWLTSDTLTICPTFTSAGFNIQLATLFSVLLLLITRFSVNYMHREAGFHRFFALISLFSSAMLLVVLSGTAVLTFIGWEIAGLCSFLLVAYAYDRPVAAQNAVLIFVTNRLGDAGFMLGIGLTYLWLGSVDWSDLSTGAAELGKGQAAAIAFCFVIAALTKSAQLPFSPWLMNAMEGPTPSSAVFYGSVMIHAGVFLLIQLQVLIDTVPLAQWLLLISGCATLLYAYLSGLSQTDVKSSHVFAILGQLGLMFVECGLGFWQLASWHLCAHAVMRCYLLLTAPSFMANAQDVPRKPLVSVLTNSRRIFVISLQRFWLDQFTGWGLIRPTRRLAKDLSYFDDNIINKLMGVPVPTMVATPAFAKASNPQSSEDLNQNHRVIHTGLVGMIVGMVAGCVHWFEERMVLQGIAKDSLHAGRVLGYLANKFEIMVLRPRYLVLFVFITFLVAF